MGRLLATGRRHAPTAVASVIVVAVCTLLILDPKAALEGGTKGLDIFVRIVFPSLLPFFIISELMIGLGLVHFLGSLVEPLMRPLFNVPGVGAFAFSMGLAAGYPMDAVITSKLRRANLCTRVEGERLLAFTNTADPLFILGAVAVGMFHRPDAAWLLAAGHYLSSFLVGLLFRFHGRHEDASAPNLPWGASGRSAPGRSGSRPAAAVSRSLNGGPKPGYWRAAFQALVRARREDGRHFGRLLADAVEESMHTLIKICGFIMLFAAIVRLLEVSGALQPVATPIGWLLALFGWDPKLAPGMVAGLLELDIGTVMVANSGSPLPQALAVAGGIIAWSGLSVHGQVASIVANTDLRLSVYVLARLLHGVLGTVLTALLLRWWPLSGQAVSDAAAPTVGWPSLALGSALPLSWLPWALVLTATGALLAGSLALQLRGLRRRS